MSRIRRVGRELIWVCLGQLLVISGGVFGVRLLTYKISPAVYGNLAIGLTAAILMQQIIFYPLGQGFLRYFSSALEEGRLNAYFRTLKFIFHKTAILIAVLAIILTAGLQLAGYTRWVWLFILAFLYALFSGYNIVFDYIQNAARHRIVLDFLVPVGMIILWGAHSLVAMAGYLVSALVIFSSQFYFFKYKIASLARLRPKNSGMETEGLTKTILDFVWPLSLWGIFTWAQLVSGRWALLVFSGSQDVGLYSVLFQFGYYPIVIVSTLALQFVTPVFFNRAGSGNDSARLIKTIRLNNLLILAAAAVTLIFVLLAYLFHRQFFLLVVAPEYRQVSGLLPLLVASGGLLALGQMMNIPFYLKTNTQILLWPKIITAVAGVILNFLGAYFYGLVGVVIAGLVFPLFYLIWVLIIHFFREKA